MAKYAPVAPIALLQQLQSKDMLGDYMLFLGHDVLKQPNAYHWLVNHEAEKGPVTVILDNSTVELGEPLESVGLLNAAANFEDCIICLPDVLRSKAGTLGAISAFMNGVDWYVRRLMAIPQGETEQEVLECADSIMELLGGEEPAMWGIPRWCANEFGTRMNIVRALRDKYGLPIHLLGCSRIIADDMVCANIPGVVGIDSANPINMGQLGRQIFVDVYNHLPRHIGAYDFWEQTVLTDEAISNVLRIREAITP